MTQAHGITRREALRTVAVAGAGATALTGAANELVARALAASPGTASSLTSSTSSS